MQFSEMGNPSHSAATEPASLKSEVLVSSVDSIRSRASAQGRSRQARG
jgi:hypothetical protein